jgi:hypothetical protein
MVKINLQIQIPTHLVHLHLQKKYKKRKKYKKDRKRNVKRDPKSHKDNKKK